MEEKREWPGKWAEHRRKSPIPPEAEKIRKWLKKTMKEKKMTQAKLSVEADVALGQISRILSGCSETRCDADEIGKGARISNGTCA